MDHQSENRFDILLHISLVQITLPRILPCKVTLKDVIIAKDNVRFQVNI